MKIKTAITSLKVEKGCVNMDCNYCTENKKCYLQQLIKENEKLKKALSDIKEIVKEISYLGSRGERELKFKIKNILEEVIDEEIY